MNELARRRVMYHAAVAASLCIGLYGFVVEPLAKRTAQARARQAACEAELRPAEGLSNRLAALTAALDRSRDEAGRIDALGRPARDERTFFASITALADASGIQIDHLAPEKIAALPPATGADPAAPIDAVAGYQITAVCTYPDLIRFLSAIQSDLGYALITSVRIAPQMDAARTVRAVIQTQHLAFSTGPAVPGPVASAGGQP